MRKEPSQTVGDMRRKAIVTDAEITEVVDVYLVASKLSAFQFASGRVLDVRVAVDEHRPARRLWPGR